MRDNQTQEATVAIRFDQTELDEVLRKLERIRMICSSRPAILRRKEETAKHLSAFELAKLVRIAYPDEA